MWKQLTFCIHGIRPWKGYKCGYAFKRGWELTPIVSYWETLSNFLLINSPPLHPQSTGPWTCQARSLPLSHIPQMSSRPSRSPRRIFLLRVFTVKGHLTVCKLLRVKNVFGQHREEQWLPEKYQAETHTNLVNIWLIWGNCFKTDLKGQADLCEFN